MFVQQFTLNHENNLTHFQTSNNFNEKISNCSNFLKIFFIVVTHSHLESCVKQVINQQIVIEVQSPVFNSWLSEWSVARGYLTISLKFWRMPQHFKNLYEQFIKTFNSKVTIIANHFKIIKFRNRLFPYNRQKSQAKPKSMDSKWISKSTQNQNLWLKDDFR